MKFPHLPTLLLLVLLPPSLMAQNTAQESGGDGNTNALRAKPERANSPRPMMMRPSWIDLQGDWDYAISDKDAIANPPEKWLGKTQIPMNAGTSATSPAEQLDATKRIWYRRQIETPELKPGQTLHLHCNSVTTEALVTVNGMLLNMHSGADAPFNTDITQALTKTPTQEIAISAWSPDPQAQATGITGEVWLEIVPRSHLSTLKITTDPSSGKVTVYATIWGQANFRTLEVRALDGDKEVASGSAFYHFEKGGYETTFTIPEPKFWSPDAPKLYGLRIRLANEDQSTHDDVTSYFALREVGNTTDAAGHSRFALNDEQIFLIGLEDANRHSAMSDSEIRSRVESIKAKGYNLIRKPAGMDSPRIYHWADRLGVIIWQDLPSHKADEKASKNRCAELQDLSARYFNHPSIAIWSEESFPDQSYTAGKTTGDLRTEPEPLISDSARAAVGIAGDYDPKSDQVEKLTERGISAAVFTGATD
ncbi:MAG: beta-galactosidase/beta-glucuronidase [Verrucomicrobiales bacterium]|jgi:beta-galactosidase/beta-glucuronidase